MKPRTKELTYQVELNDDGERADFTFTDYGTHRSLYIAMSDEATTNHHTLILSGEDIGTFVVALHQAYVDAMREFGLTEEDAA